MVKERRISKPQHIMQLMREQINILRQDETLDPIQRAKAIGYLSNTTLAAYKDGELSDKVDEVLKHIKK